MRHLSLTLFIFLLSTVVLVTDSCSSWPRRPKRMTTTSTEQPTEITTPPLVEKNPIITTPEAAPSKILPEITSKPEEPMEDRNNATQTEEATIKTDEPINIETEKPLDVAKEEPVGNDSLEVLDHTNVSGISIKPCPESFGRDYCLNDGECYVEKTLNNKEAKCKCKKPFTGHRCKETLGGNFPENQANKTVIVIGGPGVESTLSTSIGKPCPEDFGKEYCFNDGECYVENILGEINAKCKCKKPFSGSRCMQKDPEVEHKTLNSNDQANNDVTTTTTQKPLVRDIKKETININGIPCPDDEQHKHFCGGVGKCFMLMFSEIDFIIGCECEDPYYGLRCEEKRLDDYYGSGLISNDIKNGYINPYGGNRSRRHSSFDKIRSKAKRRFHSTKVEQRLR